MLTFSTKSGAHLAIQNTEGEVVSIYYHKAHTLMQNLAANGAFLAEQAASCLKWLLWAK